MVNTKTSKPESSATKAQPPVGFDKLYWLRIGFAVVAGAAADLLVGPDYINGISIGALVYFASYYFARYVWYRGLDRSAQGKIYSTGVGGFVLAFLFTWILLFTLQAVG